jgi:ELWxxDGT repeat protein
MQVPELFLKVKIIQMILMKMEIRILRRYCSLWRLSIVCSTQKSSIMRALYAYSISIFLFLSTGLYAQQANLLKDINSTVSTSSNSTSYLQVGSITFFTATLPETGTELWKTDGTPEGTVLIKDIFPGPESGGPFSLVDVQGTLYFSARDANHGGELWKSDGTESGTVLVKDILPGTLTGLQPNLINVDGTLFFWANDGIHGAELWKTDGTDAGTVMVKDLIPGPGAGAVPFTSLNRVVASGGFLFFALNDGVHGVELWRSDGTESGTFMVKDLLSQPNTGDVAHLTDIDGTLWFRGLSSAGYDLWKSDGTEAGTVLVKDLAPGDPNYGLPQNIMLLNGLVFFLASAPATGLELWTSDGSEAGTILVKDIIPGVGSGFTPGAAASNPMIGYNGQLLFRAFDGTNGTELWTSDGTEGGTVLLKDINPGTLTSNPSGFKEFNGIVYFNAIGGQGFELWRTDGTQGGTYLVKDIASGTTSSNPSFLTAGANALIFTAYTPETHFEIWKSDGTESGTMLVKDLLTSSFNVSSSPVNIAAVNNQVYFTGNNGSRVMLWKSDGTSDGTTIVKDPSPAFFSITTGTTTRYSAVKDNTYYFVSQNLWQSDGTESGTVTSNILDQAPFLIENLTPSGNLLFFKGSTSTEGAELWVHDGEGVHRVKDINPGIPPGLPALYEMVDVNGTLFFTADDGAGGIGLWKSDGSEMGTSLVKVIPNVFFGVSPLLTNINGTLFFTANNGINGHELWKSDGTESGTVMVKDINPGLASSNIGTQSIITNIVNVNGVAYFKADGGTGVELWKSDGTEQGTVKVKEIASGNESSFPANLVNANGTLFFTAYENAHGTELWKTDGTEAGTVLVKDITAGPTASHIQYTIAVGNKIYFYLTGSGIWESDGTEAGTKLIASNVSVRSAFVKAGDALYFMGYTFNTQAELWKLSFQKLIQTITFNPIPSKTSSGPGFELSATASSALPVTFSSSSDKITITGKNVALVKAGRVIVSADQPGNANYLAAPTISQEFCINPTKPVLTETITSIGLVTLTSNSSATDTHQWFKDGNIISGESGKRIDVTQSGVYKVKVLVDDCESEFSDESTIFITGIEDQENEVTLHPNPASQFVLITLPKSTTSKSMTLISPQGTEVQHFTTEEDSIYLNVTAIPSGIYLVKIQHGKSMITRKLVRK